MGVTVYRRLSLTLISPQSDRFRFEYPDLKENILRKVCGYSQSYSQALHIDTMCKSDLLYFTFFRPLCYFFALNILMPVLD